jgi:hypothetical protein
MSGRFGGGRDNGPISGSAGWRLLSSNPPAKPGDDGAYLIPDLRQTSTILVESQTPVARGRHI